MTTAAIVDGLGNVTNVIVADANHDVIPGYTLVNYTGVAVTPQGFTYNSVAKTVTNGVITVTVTPLVVVVVTP